MIEIDLRCPLCGHQGLVMGYAMARDTIGPFGPARQAVVFMPDGKRMWRGYDVAAFACLECGFVGQLLSPDAVQELREWVEKERSKQE